MFTIFSLCFLFHTKTNIFYFVNGLQHLLNVKKKFIFSNFSQIPHVFIKFLKFPVFPCLEKFLTRFPVFPVMWPPCQLFLHFQTNLRTTVKRIIFTLFPVTTNHHQVNNHEPKPIEGICESINIKELTAAKVQRTLWCAYCRNHTKHTCLLWSSSSAEHIEQSSSFDSTYLR